MSENTPTTRKPYFDYIAEDKDTRGFLRKKAEHGKAILKRTSQGIWEMGQLLTEVKEQLPHGKFGIWIEFEFQMSASTAWRFMQVYDAFKSFTVKDLNIPPTALYALSSPSIDDETRGAAIELIQSGDLQTADEIKSAIAPPQPDAKSFTVKDLKPNSEHETPEKVPVTDTEKTDEYGDGELLQEAPILAAETDDETDYESEERAAIQDDKPAPPPTLKEAVKSAKVVHDTLTDAPKKSDDDLTDNEWLELMPVYRVLSKLGGKGILARRDLLSIRTLQQSKSQSNFVHHAKRTETYKAGGTSPLSNILSPIVTLPDPRDWQICAPCRGIGCTRCGHAGYDLTGSGISPLRVERGEVSL